MFYMYVYILDAICFKTLFPLVNWNWSPDSFDPIHIYHDKLWEENTKEFFYEICHNVIVPIHEVLYGYPPPRIFNKIIKNFKKNCKMVH